MEPSKEQPTGESKKPPGTTDDKPSSDVKKAPAVRKAAGKKPSAKKIVVKPEATLTPRPMDRILSQKQLDRLELFSKLKKKPNIVKFPGTTILRKYNKGDIICRQGERGHSAFYILKAEDVLALYEEDQKSENPELTHSAESIAQLRDHVQQIAGTTRDDAKRVVASAKLQLGAVNKPRPRGFFNRLAKSIFGDSQSPASKSPGYIPNDGPQDIDYATRSAPMYQGDVFGEMSCMTLAPRSATIVAETECYMFEFLRNIFDAIQRDDGYRQWMAAIYRDRVLATHLQRLEIFSDLSPEQLKFVRSKAELEIFDAGTVICNEDEPSDSVYIVRTGLVQVVKGVRGADVAVNESDILDWSAFCQELVASNVKEEPEKPAAPVKKEHPAKAPTPGKPDIAAMLAAKKKKVDPKKVVWNLLSAEVHQAIEQVSSSSGSVEEEKSLIIHALNELIKSRDLVDAKDLATLIKTHKTLIPTRTFPSKVKQWTGLEICIGSRLLLQAIFPKLLQASEHSSGGPLRVLAYLGRGEVFGEMGVVLNENRSATCITYDHPPDDPNREPGRVELVRINADVFHELLDQTPKLREKVDALIMQRATEIEEEMSRKSWERQGSLESSPEFRDRGFIQGQKLLLIDLNRCTRCGDCVRACVNTHDDGYTRLFLDGPRFDRFLVPSACRQCMNPACMIGCPVGSIQRGDNGEIKILDWCIGCSLCARQCPYDSIQMHDLGIIPENSEGWKFSPQSAIPGQNWYQNGFSDNHWSSGSGPFHWEIDFQTQIACNGEKGGWSVGSSLLKEPICFRHEFTRHAEEGSTGPVRLLLTSKAPALKAWIDGREIQLRQQPPQKRRGEHEARLDAKDLPLGRHLLAVQIGPEEDGENEPFDLPYAETVLSARIDTVPETESSSDGVLAEVELVTEKAVVCDLCSSLPSKDPACVTQCPHEAAMRVDARFEFPLG